jgi:thioredoxin-dependent peroxiredoxin
VVLGVSTDGVASHAAFKSKYGLPFVLLADEDRAIVNAYEVWKPRPRPDGTSPMGIERSTFIIDGDGRIARIFRNVKVDGHVDEVLAALGEMR